MEYVPLGDLEKYMSGNGPMQEADAQQVSFQILEGLSYMHREGFAHRDVKPGVSPSSFNLWRVSILTIAFQERAHQITPTKEQMVGQDQRLWHKQTRRRIQGTINRQRHNPVHGTRAHLARGGKPHQLHGRRYVGAWHNGLPDAHSHARLCYPRRVQLLSGKRQFISTRTTQETRRQLRRHLVHSFSHGTSP